MAGRDSSASTSSSLGEGMQRAWEDVGTAVPVLHSHPRLSLAACLTAAGLGAWYYRRCPHQSLSSLSFASRLCAVCWLEASFLGLGVWTRPQAVPDLGEYA